MLESIKERIEDLIDELLAYIGRSEEGPPAVEATLNAVLNILLSAVEAMDAGAAEVPDDITDEALAAAGFTPGRNMGWLQKGDLMTHVPDPKKPREWWIRTKSGQIAFVVSDLCPRNMDEVATLTRRVNIEWSKRK